MAPKVSVAMITYNHADFISQAIESVLSQCAPFQIELVIGEDCSADETRVIVDDYARRNPHIIRAILQPRNLGGPENFRAVLRECRGDYIALLEGDDFWSDSTKLTTQLHILEENPSVYLCTHGTVVNARDNQTLVDSNTAAYTIHSLEAILRRSVAHTSSFVFRRELLRHLPSWYWTQTLCDWSLQVIAAQLGPIYKCTSIMSVYRDHGRGMWSSLHEIDRLELILDALAVFDEHLEGHYAKLINSAKQEHCLSYAHELRGQKRISEARRAVIKSLKFGLAGVWRSPRRREALLLLFPWLGALEYLRRPFTSAAGRSA